MRVPTLVAAVVVVLATFATAHDGKPVDDKTPSCGAPFCARRFLSDRTKSNIMALKEAAREAQTEVVEGAKAE
ncbi:hypothetical protein A1F94_006622 [Pyrenophora tritici-repentis]|uniref:Uncharacterized protein n=2 Tax=Pyrenophora tritici-repentis TaxID=45151 RepID=A0A2W1DP42_9PLEO|nr:uncharacterized protein PTRG_04970 [Pyrenophora tritici-repentis Pt-1C-BFP]KAF7447201.1 hypothetical protein A1F99_086480 [Pyrenophora tritici-repentis]EDU47877.1 predicted protein [Pyrenophora tritici-repentis Pt-1C-BFP]KAF7569549.1 hypothetical protein PtrM4_119640 [Pyrenophora tritici-repentis]KAG9382701.1 hypothetical protein A1F94_006622 [Pyrenophora tritici-repentis]KAI1510335.1 hypothetical protein Ptr86124_010781 [Pyrenophora tritici-repentis]